MPLTFKLSFEHFDFNDEEFLNDLKRVNNYYDNVVVLEYKENKQKILKEFGKDYLKSDIFLEDEPYIISTIQSDGREYNIKVSKY